MAVFIRRLFRQCQSCARIRGRYGGDFSRPAAVASGSLNVFRSMSLIGSSLIFAVGWVQERWYSSTGVTRLFQLELMERIDGFDCFTPFVQFDVSQNPMSGLQAPRVQEKKTLFVMLTR